nr:PREDICTED: E3 ubiquitin-protein ligase RNF167-like [Anolis carolinensis]|eukprot:XP_016854743.1 PREDICTED: E3 ubiquitin-protein ligase RNF167-like [Anolis carolinensis]
MVWDDEHLHKLITIPSVFIGETAATYLRRFFTYEKGGQVILIPEYIFPLGYYLIPFTGVVGIVFAVMCTILVSHAPMHGGWDPRISGAIWFQNQLQFHAGG